MTTSTGLLLQLATCWSVVILSAVCMSAGPGDNGLQAHGVSANGVSQKSLDQAPSLQASPAQAVPAQLAGTPAPTRAMLIPLADPSLALTAAKRHQLTYLVRCALPAHVRVYTEYGGERFTFEGSMGLAPRWLTAAMTPSEERWVSACLLAHVNYFGKHVRVSMRATPPPSPAFEADANEQQTYTIFEGGFFGNLFLPQPVAYTCQGMRTPAQAQDPIFQDRVCTQETGETTAEGTPLTVCHVLLTGHCENPLSFTVDGTYYSEVILVYLKPGKE